LLEVGRQVPDAALPERDALYQSRYKEVRSEHDSIHNAYEDARRQLTERNPGRALEICDEFLGRYPNDPVFQALTQANIFKEACGSYPNEQQFQQSLKLTRERRDLAFSIVMFRRAES